MPHGTPGRRARLARILAGERSRERRWKLAEDLTEIEGALLAARQEVAEIQTEADRLLDEVAPPAPLPPDDPQAGIAYREIRTWGSDRR